MALTVHEFSHGFIAHLLGDKTAKADGRLTLNPLKHIDWFGALAMLIVGFGWAKPVMINPMNLKNPKTDFALIAAAGPISNFIWAFLLFGIMSLVAVNTFAPIEIIFIDGIPYRFEIDQIRSMPIDFMVFKDSIGTATAALLTFLMMGAWFSLALGMFNMIPFPPLDGSKIFGAILPEPIYWRFVSGGMFTMLILMVLLFTGTLGGFLIDFVTVLYSGMVSFWMNVLG